MEEKRQNNLEETELFHAVFKISKVTYITFITVISLSVIASISALIWALNRSWREERWITFVICLGVGVIFGLAFLTKILLVKKNSCVVTNKRILGIKQKGLVIKTFSYRLDKIDKVEAISYLGMRLVKFEFSKGSTGVNPVYYQTPKTENFSLSNVHNHIEFYENLSKLIVVVKNDTDVVVHIATN